MYLGYFCKKFGNAFADNLFSFLLLKYFSGRTYSRDFFDLLSCRVPIFGRIFLLGILSVTRKTCTEKKHIFSHFFCLFGACFLHVIGFLALICLGQFVCDKTCFQRKTFIFFWTKNYRKFLNFFLENSIRYGFFIDSFILKRTTVSSKLKFLIKVQFLTKISIFGQYFDF